MLSVFDEDFSMFVVEVETYQPADGAFARDSMTILPGGASLP